MHGFDLVEPHAASVVEQDMVSGGQLPGLTTVLPCSLFFVGANIALLHHAAE
jgi:hypothetical protein